jgi:hypothetical protein
MRIGNLPGVFVPVAGFRHRNGARLGNKQPGRERHRGRSRLPHGGGCKEAAMLDTILHDRIRELEGKLRQNAPATKADIDDLQARLAKIEKLLETLCRDMHSSSSQRVWRFRRGEEHPSRRNVAA